MRKIFMVFVMAFIACGCAATTAKTGPQEVMSKGGDFYVYENHDRFYVLGSQESLDKFMASGHLPYTRTLIGAGPNGETVIFEVNKKDPALADRLQKEFSHTPFLIESSGSDYYVYKMGDRYYVIGQEETSDKFIASGHLPYTRTLLGAGPTGETVVFEVDKKNPQLADRLVKTYM
ncbi:MAG: hypothetical protein PVJ25_00025 [Desulfuromonadales bacterium]|jgi:hypothetical protein